MSRRGHVLALAPVLAAAGALALVGLRPVDTELVPAAPTDAPVKDRTLTCFGLPIQSQDSQVPRSLAVGSPAPWTTESTQTRGRVNVRGQGIGAGKWAVSTLPADSGGEVDVEATGSAAPAVTAVSALRAPAEAGAGLAAQQCAEPARQWWFVGAGSSTERDGTIVLYAPKGVDAVVDLVLRGPDGVLDAVGTDDLRIAAGDTEVVRLSRVVAGTENVAIEVTASQGRVVAAVADTLGGGIEPQGTEWVPASGQPATSVLVPAIGGEGGGDGSYVLVVANSENASVVARPTLMTSSGRTVVPDAESLQVPAGGVATVELPGNIRPGTTVEVRADGAVTAAVRTDTGADVALPAGALPLAGPTVVPLAVGAVAPDRELVVAAQLVDPEAQTALTRRIRVAGFDESGAELGSGGLRLDAGTSAVVDLGDELGLSSTELDNLAYAVLDPGPGAESVPVFAAVELSGPGGWSVLPLRSPLTTVTVPALVPRVVPPTG